MRSFDLLTFWTMNWFLLWKCLIFHFAQKKAFTASKRAFYFNVFWFITSLPGLFGISICFRQLRITVIALSTNHPSVFVFYGVPWKSLTSLTLDSKLQDHALQVQHISHSRARHPWRDLDLSCWATPAPPGPTGEVRGPRGIWNDR